MLAVAVVATQVRFDWLHPLIAAVTRKDPGHRRDRLDLAPRRAAARNLLPPGTIVGVPNWRDAGKIAYALGPDVTTLCLNRDARQFGIAWPPAHFVGADVLILAPEHGERVAAELGSDVRQHRAAARCIDPPCRPHAADGCGVPGEAAARLAASGMMA